MSEHGDLMAAAVADQFDVQADVGRVRLQSPRGDTPWPIRAVVGLIEVAVETVPHGETVRTYAVETCRVTVEAAKFANQPPNSSWRAEVDGEWWPVDRATSAGSVIYLHLKRKAQKRAGVRHE